jgi:hypothetical protein
MKNLRHGPHGGVIITTAMSFNLTSKHFCFGLSALTILQQLTNSMCRWRAVNECSYFGSLRVRYFSLQATRSVRFEDYVRKEVENNLSREDGVQADCFSTPRRIIYCYIERVCLLHKLFRDDRENTNGFVL